MTDTPTSSRSADAYFERIDATHFKPTFHAGGAWNPSEIHFSPLGGLIVHAMELHREATGGGDKQLGRVSFDILGFLADDVCEVSVETIRPGRTIELIEATVKIGGRPVALARAWFMSGDDTTAVEGGEPDRLPNPDAVESWDLTKTWDLTQTWTGGYVASLEERAVKPPQPGRTTAWLRTPLELVADEPASSTARFIALVDTANGIAVRESPKAWMFPNLDLTIHLYRQPTGPWVGLDTTVTFGSTGRGLTSTVLHDVDGPLGRAAQILTLRPMP
jgi:acyl-CoA thioesterase